MDMFRWWRRRKPSTQAYFVKEGLELCFVLAGLAIAAGFTWIPLWVWLALPSIKVLSSILSYIFFFRKSLHRNHWHEPASLVGRTAHTLTPLNPEGQVKIAGGIWRANSRSGEVIPCHHDVVITEADGHLLLVEEEQTTVKES